MPSNAPGPDPATPPSLVFCTDSEPGISRKRTGKGFSYHLPSGERITDPGEIERLRRIALPPAYTGCWFATDPAAHLQACGYDARGRKQYRYHPAYREGQEAEKFGGCAAFGAALPAMRERIEVALRSRKVSRERTLAALVRLLDIGMVRVGNARYARENRSYGATTLTRRHAVLEQGSLMLRYRGKSGRMHERRIRDAGLVRFVRAVQDLPGQRLFQYLDDAGERHDMGSADVNAYIRETMGEGWSAKSFRTWGASVVAFGSLYHGEGQVPLKEMLRIVADALGNTPAISRKSYVHPALIDLAKAGDQTAWRRSLRLPRATRWLAREERGLIAFLETI